MSTAELRFSLHQLIDGVSDNSVLQAVYTLLSKANTSAEDVDSWYEGLSDSAKASIQRGIDDANNGRFVSQEDVQARINKRLGRA